MTGGALLRRPPVAVAAATLALAFIVLAIGRHGLTTGALALLPLLGALAVLAVLDVHARLIPDVLTLPVLAYALARSAALGVPPLGDAVLGLLVAGGLLLAVAVVSNGGVGGGDVKLMAALGATLGWKSALLVLALSQVLGLAAGLGLAVAGRAGRKTPLPIGALIAVVGGLAIIAAD